MPIPKPNSGEKESDYMSRCIEFLVNEGTDNEQAIAICSTKWNEKTQNMKTILISGEIGYPASWQNDPAMADRMANVKEEMRIQLKEISESKDDIIKVEIESYGGDVNHAIAMRNALANNPAKIEIEYTGWSASAATIIATAGDTVKAAENIMILPHEARGGAFGTKDNINAYAQWLEKTNDTIAEMYAKKTGKDKEFWREKMALNNGEGEWITAAEAYGLGLIDEVYEPMKAAACFDFPDNLPAIPELKMQIINELNMNLFKKQEKEEQLPVNMLQIGDMSAVYQGELKANTELVALNGAKLENGEYEHGENILVVENSVVMEVKAPDMKAIVAEKETKINTLVSELEALKAEKEELNSQMATMQAENQAKIDELNNKLAGIKSTHQVDEKANIEQIDTMPLSLKIKKEIKAEIEKRKNKEE